MLQSRDTAAADLELRERLIEDHGATLSAQLYQSLDQQRGEITELQAKVKVGLVGGR